MEKKIRKQLKKQLEKERKRIIKDLKSFARRDSRLKGNWRTRFPILGLDRSHKDENAEEIEQYATLLSVEHTLEVRLKDIEDALEKIKKNTYGRCEKCQKEIEEKRLKVVPEARLCLKCSQEQGNK